jgi:predicted  nucleic acid-binding Zn-ribbon protein
MEIDYARFATKLAHEAAQERLMRLSGEVLQEQLEEELQFAQSQLATASQQIADLSKQIADLLEEQQVELEPPTEEEADVPEQ